MANNTTTEAATETTDTATLMGFAATIVEHFQASRFNSWDDEFVTYVACGTQIRCFGRRNGRASADRECIIDILRVSYETCKRDLVTVSPFAGNGFKLDERFTHAMSERVKAALVMVKP